ncbi:hypothetical protein GGS24DRAFT_455580 [Hypoxylon argillaceum]|nr:hypothetical protein GGS24DRAFT_455580 [Hypoxylon argillaceum]
MLKKMAEKMPKLISSFVQATGASRPKARRDITTKRAGETTHDRERLDDYIELQSLYFDSDSGEEEPYVDICNMENNPEFGSFVGYDQWLYVDHRGGSSQGRQSESSCEEEHKPENEKSPAGSPSTDKKKQEDAKDEEYTRWRRAVGRQSDSVPARRRTVHHRYVPANLNAQPRPLRISRGRRESPIARLHIRSEQCPCVQDL